VTYKKKDHYTTIKMIRIRILILLVALACPIAIVTAFIPLLDGGKDIPKIYDCYFDSQIAKQASTAVAKAVGAGKTKLEIFFPPVPNLDEVKFGTPLNKKFGTTIVAKELSIPGGYRPGSDLSRQQVAFANVYWAKTLANAMGGAPIGGKQVNVISAEPVTVTQIKNKGQISRLALLQPGGESKFIQGNSIDASYIAINPGGEEIWERLRTKYQCTKGPFLVLNNAYSTTYGLGNKAGYEEVFYMKRISKGWIYRAYPGPWKAYLEKPNGACELLKSYTTKPQLNEVATLVREESFKRYAINNDRWSPGFGERL
jgi:Domain of unknown function (DUF1995)